MNLLDKISNRLQLTLVALVVFSMFVGLACISAADLDSGNSQIAVDGLNNPILQNNTFTMTVKTNPSTGYHWEISPKTHGVELMSEDYVPDNPNKLGSPGTCYYNFFVQNEDDYYVQLDLISPTNETVDSVDSDMLN